MRRKTSPAAIEASRTIFTALEKRLFLSHLHLPGEANCFPETLFVILPLLTYENTHKSPSYHNEYSLRLTRIKHCAKGPTCCISWDLLSSLEADTIISPIIQMRKLRSKEITKHSSDTQLLKRLSRDAKNQIFLTPKPRFNRNNALPKYSPKPGQPQVCVEHVCSTSTLKCYFN